MRNKLSMAGFQSPMNLQSQILKLTTGEPKTHWRLSRGFTLVELMVSMGILMILFALTSINITRLPSVTSQAAQFDTLMADIKHQQTLSMSGATGGGIDAESFGVHLEETGYTLFKGSSYSSSDPYNFTVELEPTLSFINITWPGGDIVFEKGTGDVVGYSAGADRFSISNSITGDVQEVRLNKYGATY